MSRTRIVLLGPQRLRPTVREALDDLGVTGRVATVTAGWEEREGEDAELDEHLAGRTVNLGLFPRAEAVFAEDPELLAGFQQRRDRVRALAALYRRRLGAQLRVARELLASLGTTDDPELLEPEVLHAIECVRELDAHHLARVRDVEAAFRDEVRPAERPVVRRHRDELAEILAGVEALAIAGGHVAVLLNRLRLFDILGQHGERPVVAWSAGTMALTEHVVLFHDSPPQGAGNAELHCPGLGIVRGLVCLPHARRRLALEDPDRVALFARRFAPARCFALDEGSRIDGDGQTWRARKGTPVLGEAGEVQQEVPA